MKRFIIHSILFSLPLVLGSLLLFVLPFDKQFAYHFVKGECSNKASWMYHRVFEDERPVDIVFSGASQTGSAIMDEFITKELNQKHRENIEVVNYGYCRRGRDIQYTMLKDLFAKKHPSILVLEVSEDEPKKSHPVFPYLADSNDLWGSLVMFNQRYISSIWKGITIRFESLKSKIFCKTLVDENTDYPRFGYRASSRIVSTEIIAQNAQKWKHRLAKKQTALRRKIELNYSLHYLEKIVQLSSKNNCEIVFLYLRESGSNLNVPLLKNEYLNFGELIILPNEIFENTNNWKDATHFNNTGAQKTSNYLIPVLAGYLK